MAEARPRRRSSIGERARSVSDALASDALGDRWPAEGQATAAAPAPPSPIIEAPAPKGFFFTGDPEKDHDMANLVLLSIILALDGCYCLALALANDDGATATRLFGVFYTFSVAYFVCDTIFILRVPACCKTPSVIVGHHVVVMLYTLLPFFYPELGWCMAACLSVELVTVLLILKRQWPHPIWEVLFYAAWVGIRLVYYPYLCFEFAKLYLEQYKAGRPFHPVGIAPVFQVLLTALSFYWTSILLINMAKRRKKKSEKKA